MDAIKIGQFITVLRKEQGMTQAELAEALNVTVQAVSKWECGKGLPQVNIIAPLANVLGVTTAEILSAQKVAHAAPTLDETGIEKLFLGYMRSYEREKREKRYKTIRITIVSLVVAIVIVTILSMASRNIYIPIRFGGNRYQTITIKRDANDRVYLIQQTYPSQLTQCRTVSDENTGRRIVFIASQVSAWDYLFGTADHKLYTLISGNVPDAQEQQNEFGQIYYCNRDITDLTQNNYMDYVLDTTRDHLLWEHR